MGRRDMVCMGVIAGAHGVRGLVRVRSFAHRPEAIAAYGPLWDEAGDRRFELTVSGRAKDCLLARVAGVADRDGAAALRGTRLYAARDALPELADDDEFYVADLIGLRAETADGAMIGEVVAVNDFGAGEVMEIRRPDKPPLALPFTRAHAPLVDLAGGRVVVVVGDWADAPDKDRGS